MYELLGVSRSLGPNNGESSGKSTGKLGRYTDAVSRGELGMYRKKHWRFSKNNNSGKLEESLNYNLVP